MAYDFLESISIFYILSFNCIMIYKHSSSRIINKYIEAENQGNQRCKLDGLQRERCQRGEEKHKLPSRSIYFCVFCISNANKNPGKRSESITSYFEETIKSDYLLTAIVTSYEYFKNISRQSKLHFTAY